MKRVLVYFITVVLVVGLMPASSFAEDGLQAQSPLGTAEIGDVTATFTDAKLYNAVVAQLDEQGVEHTSSSDDNTVTIASGEAAKVESLNLSYSSISNLTGIGALDGLPHLARIDLSHNALEGTAGAPLADLIHITYLDLYENKLNDWSFLESLVGLEHLNIGYNYRGGDTKCALKKLQQLKWLDFSFPRDEEGSATQNQVVECVSELPELEYLDLCKWNFNSLTGMENLAKLKTLMINYNHVKDLSPLASCTALEELHVAYNWLYRGSNPGLGSLVTDDGKLAVKLKKLDLWGQESPGQDNNLLFSASSTGHQRVNALYQLHKQRKLELGYDYRWIDELVAMEPHDGRYIAYDDFGTWCREGSDDFNAMRNAHNYANNHGCEVRSTVGEGANAAAGKTYHIYKLFDQKEYFAYTNVDWQGATFIIHDEDIDWHYRCSNKPLLSMRPSPAGLATADVRPSANTRTFEVDTAKALTINEGALPLRTNATSIAGLSPEVDAAIAELNALGYSRYYVQLYDKNVMRFRRGYSYRRPGEPQWDALIVDGNGTVQRFNAATLAGDETPANSYIPDNPEPLQWQFDNITKVVIAPIAGTQAHIRNANFVTMPLNSKREVPAERPSSGYYRNLSITGGNFELGGIVQTVGTAEDGYDNGNLSGSYVGFIDLKDCAEFYMHDCATWQRTCTSSTYGFQTIRVMCGRIKNVGDSNNPYRGGHGNHGGNYAKHMLWEGIYLGRIDQHTGCYDMAVRDSNLHEMSLTGAGPLTIERTTVTSTRFMSLRADYGSTWSGVAHVIDCTHFPTLSSDAGPDTFCACTPDIGWDFGYVQHFPELHVKNFTIDCSKYRRKSGTRYRIDYGIVSNYLNGLNTMEDYYPDTVEVDGLNVVNWRDYIGYELHVLLPLYMQGKAAERARAGGWTLKNVRYDDEYFVPASLEGEDEFAPPGRAEAADGKGRERNQYYYTFTSEQKELLEAQLETHDVVVAYSGDEPSLLMRTTKNYGNDSWVTVYPYFVEHRGSTEVAYYSGRELVGRLRSIWDNHPDAGFFDRLGIYAEHTDGKNGEVQDGVTDIEHVRLANTREKRAHEHKWDEGTVTKQAIAYAEGTLTFTCEDCGATKTETIPATVSEGETYKVAGSIYRVTANTAEKRTVTLVKAKRVKSGKGFTLPASVKIKGAKYKVTGIGAKAFKANKARTLTLKTKMLKASTVKNSLKGSKVSVVKVKVGKKSKNKKFAVKYRKAFKKKNCGKKVRIKA